MSAATTTTLRIGATGKRRLAISAIVLFLLSMMVQYASFAAVPSVLAAHDEGIFELDGDALDDTDPDFANDADWEDGAEGAADTFFAGAASEAAANDTTYLQTGNSKDENDVSSWVIATTGAPDKNELLDAYAAVYQVSGETWVYFGADRFDNDGTAQIGFWFFQDELGIANGAFTGGHVDGDVLIISEYTNGGVVSTICAYVWDSADDGDNIANTGGCDPATNGSNLDLVASGAGCDVSGGEGQFDICAVTNSVVTDAPWTFLNKDGDDDFGKGQFFEGGLNLSDMFGGDAPCFGTFLAETRTSAQTDAQLKDIAFGDFNTCVPPDLETEASVSAADFGDQVTDTATLSGSLGEVEGTITFFICEPGEITSGGCEGDAGTQVGDPVTIDNGEAVSGAYTVGTTSDAVGTYCWRAEYAPDAESDYLPTSHTNATTECFEVGEATIDLEKTADDDSVPAGGQIGFTVTISNTGVNTALGIDFTDNLPGGTGIDWVIESQSGTDFSISGSPGSESLVFAPTSLAGGAASWVHIVSNTTAASCGTYDNTATVTTTNDGEDEADDSVFVECPGLAIDKVDSTGTFDEVGDVINYSITVTNTGNTTLTNVVVTDPNAAGLDCSADPGTQTTIPSMAPGAAVTCTASHTVTQDDLDAGHYFNQACADDNNGDGETGADPVCDDVDTPGEQNPALDIVKDDAGATYDSVGDVIHYTIVATNVGNVTLQDVVITDPNAVNLVCDPALPVDDFAPGDQISCTAEHVVTQADIDAGSYLNTACVDDGNGDGDTGADEDCDEENTPGSQNPRLQIVKDDAGATYDEVGDVIEYTIVVTNIGNVTLNDVVVTDENVTDLECTPATPVDLAPGEQIHCTASHTVTQEDLDNGSYLNTACADDDGLAAEVCDDEDTPGDQNPLLAIDKSVAEVEYTEVGQVLHYTIVATNVGNVTLHEVVVTDEQVTDLVCDPATPVPALAPGESITCTASHTVTQEDLDIGFFFNEACADDGMGDGDEGAAEVCDDVTTPGQQAQGETDSPTLPDTSSGVRPGSSGPGGGAWLLIVALGLLLASVVMVTPRRNRQRR